MAPSEYSVLCIVIVVLVLYSRWVRQRSSALPLPPGPPKLPVIGNLLDMPKESPWITYAAWGLQYDSDIIHVDVVGTSIVILNSAKATNDLLVKKSGIYSSRPPLFTLRTLMDWDWNVAIMPYGDMWLAHRKILQTQLSKNNVLRFHPHAIANTNSLLRNLLASPRDFADHLIHATGSFVISAAYGIDTLPANDPYVSLSRDALAGAIVAAQPSAFLVENFPILQYVPSWFPGASFQRQVHHWRKLVTDMVNLPFEAMKRDIASGTARVSVASSCLESVDPRKADSEEKETLVRHTMADIIAGSMDTMPSTLIYFVLAMVQNPGVQAKAQDELDAVVGKDCFPDFSDEPSLPYISAIIKETLRVQPVAPLAVPHTLMQDDVYKGYCLPAGTMVFGNTWAMLHDEAIYPEPHLFKPERFLKDGRLDPAVPDPAAWAFGYGRRVCPGQALAQSFLFIVIASILATLELSRARDADGLPIEPAGAYDSTILCIPLPFPCTIRPRSRAAERMIAAAL